MCNVLWVTQRAHALCPLHPIFHHTYELYMLLSAIWWFFCTFNKSTSISSPHKFLPIFFFISALASPMNHGKSWQQARLVHIWHILPYWATTHCSFWFWCCCSMASSTISLKIHNFRYLILQFLGHVNNLVTCKYGNFLTIWSAGSMHTNVSVLVNYL